MAELEVRHGILIDPLNGESLECNSCGQVLTREEFAGGPYDIPNMEDFIQQEEGTYTLLCARCLAAYQ